MGTNVSVVEPVAQPVVERPIVRCERCGTRQYEPRLGRCVKCKKLFPLPVTKLEIWPVIDAVNQKAPKRDITSEKSNDAIVQNLGQRIAQLRTVRGLTQSELQKQSKVSRSYLSRIESGQMTPSLGTLEKLADAMSLPLRAFFDIGNDALGLFTDPFVTRIASRLWDVAPSDWQRALDIIKERAENNNRKI